MIKVSFTMQDNTDAFKAAKDAALVKAMELIGQECENAVKDRTPVGTPESTEIVGYHGGNLRNSIVHEVVIDGDTIKAIIGTATFYAVWVELGTGIHAANGDGRKTPWGWEDFNGDTHFTWGMKPRHYMKNGIEAVQPKMEKMIEQCLKGQ